MFQQHIMTKEDAKDILKHHSVQHTDVNHPKSENGFLGMLRPFQGHLREENYHEVIEAVKIFAHDFQEHDHIDKEVISALWGICHLA